MQKKSYRVHILALMLVLFIDGMGQGIIFPILSSSVSNIHSTLFFSGESLMVRHFWYGLLVGVYYLMWFISAPVLGDWSDSVGRKKSLMVCLILAVISFLLSAFAFDVGSLALLLVARLLGGATSGDQAIAKAAVIDICPDRYRSVYLGLVLCAVTLGLVLGPLIGSILQNPGLLSWFNIKTPFYFSAAVSVFNITLLGRYFNETIESKVLKTITLKKVQWSKSVKLILGGFTQVNIRFLLVSYCLTQVGWQVFYIGMQNFIIHKFHINIIHASVALSLIGVGVAVGLGWLPFLFRKVDPKITALIGYGGLVVGIICLVLSNSVLIVYIIVVPVAALFGLAAVNVLTLFSQYTPQQRQGWMMGITGSIVALTGAVGAMITGLLSGIGVAVPYIFSIMVFMIGSVYLYLCNNDGDVYAD